jgi:hypothetical protein
VTWVMSNHVSVKQRKCRCRIGARFAPNVPQALKLFWTHSVVLLGDDGQVESRFSPFGDSIRVGAR